MSLTASERETTITSTDDSGEIWIWTNQRKYLGRLRRHASFTEVNSGFHSTTEWAEFTIPADQWNPATGAKRKSKPMTEEQRAAAGARLAAGRSVSLSESQGNENGSPSPNPTAGEDA